MHAPPLQRLEKEVVEGKQAERCRELVRLLSEQGHLTQEMRASREGLIMYVVLSAIPLITYLNRRSIPSPEYPH